jgi:hypothetical protein
MDTAPHHPVKENPAPSPVTKKEDVLVPILQCKTISVKRLAVVAALLGHFFFSDRERAFVYIIFIVVMLLMIKLERASLAITTNAPSNHSSSTSLQSPAASEVGPEEKKTL